MKSLFLVLAVTIVSAMISAPALGEVLFFEDFIDATWNTRPEFYETEEKEWGYIVVHDPCTPGTLNYYCNNSGYPMGGFQKYIINAPAGLLFENLVLTGRCYANNGAYGYAGIRLCSVDESIKLESSVVGPGWETLTVDASADPDFTGIDSVMVVIYGIDVTANDPPADAINDWLQLDGDLVVSDLCADVIGAYGSEGDFNLDCHTNMTDLSILASEWLDSIDPCNPNGDTPWIRSAPFDDTLTIHYVGEYWGVPWPAPGAAPVGNHQIRCEDLTMSLATSGCWDADDPNWNNAILDTIGTAARGAWWGGQQGNALLPHLDFWTGAEQFTGTPEAVSVYSTRIDIYLDAMAEVGLLDSFAGIVLAEENVTSRAAILDDLYDHVKANYDIDVYQWWGPETTVPSFLVGADGWVIDTGVLDGVDLRRYVQRFIITGKPVVVVPNAEWAQGSPSYTAAQWSYRHALMNICREYNLPACFRWIYYPAALGGEPTIDFRYGVSTYMDTVSNWVISYTDEVQAYASDYAGLASADSATGDGIAMGPLGGVDLNFADDFATSEFIVNADIEGFRHLLWEETLELALRSWNGDAPSASLIYRFTDDGNTANYPTCSVDVSDVASGSSVSLSISPDGVTWYHTTTATSAQTLSIDTNSDANFAGISEFQVKIEMSGTLTTGDVAVRIDNVGVTADIQ
ncbi:MAG: hypothetical protein JW936_10205 [Sedimentisphaerales bacterium]|nr:hypothetical protein [Sedimentisphaerales bacterium]